MNSVKSLTKVKKRTNLSLDGALLQEAKHLGINISNSAEKGIEQAVRERKQALWLEDNAQAIESSNEFVNKQGLPLAKYRNF
ncbi:type II toxin-antitoxin system CcdA family antitoxin [Lacimicrobium alkaliphilum]|uniref:Post-segregation antitoxin CcdA n=1 Tax=Lacimicrobium alkaliphilum TaxID=1526571 RepID=A0A0U2ZE18_9ALTE|nr:type II toxin-antitoxin system CcdA family antitoxin [Lacimicrobium alkaliphilum]ALS97367.1 post-segregation antitoxin CcdA [Lacimicrobium alkaliphilum]